nr:hypothetical protein [Tanacetum cinerariifolium]
MIELREMFQAWLQQQAVNLDSYSPEPSQYQKIPIYYDDDDDEEKFNSKNFDAVIESFSPSAILVEDSDSLMKEIDLFFTSDDLMPPGIENDDYDSEWDILILEEFLRNDSLLLYENESFHFDIPSSPHPLAKPLDDDGIYFNDEPVMGILTVNMVGDIFEHYVLMPRLLPTQPTLCPVIDTLLSFSSENEDKVHLLSHRGFKAF